MGDTMAVKPTESATCGNRIQWVIDNRGKTESDACQQVGEEFPTLCGACAPVTPEVNDDNSNNNNNNQGGGDPSSGLTRVMSYNTVYSGYPCCGGDRVAAFGDMIERVSPAVVGVQECQDADYLAQTMPAYSVAGTGGSRGNNILYDPSKVEFLGNGGQQVIISDTYATRIFVYGKFREPDGTEFWFFNTHLPHNLGDATDRNSHARIAQSMLTKMRELNTDGDPVVVVCDCNPFASSGASMGSFESNLNQAGFTTAYVGTGSLGGYGFLDKIFVMNGGSSNGAEYGQGASDHPAISADLSL